MMSAALGWYWPIAHGERSGTEMMTAATTTSAEPGADRYRQAERRLWSRYGLEPTERFVELSSPAVKLRVVEVGSGPAVLFIPGTAGTGPYWGALVRELKGFRCLLLDRPGWGLSTPRDYSSVEYRSAVADILRGALDVLEIDRADVVGASIGDLWPCSLRLGTRPGSAGSSYWAESQSWPRAAPQASSG
jgi:hypothetical protein